MIRQLSYLQVKNSLKTGDLVLFHGVQIMSRLIEIIEWSYWSHVGMVILPQDIGIKDTTEPLFWESTASGDGLYDYISKGTKEGGPMLVSLSDRIKVDIDQNYDTNFKVKYASLSMGKSQLEKLYAYILKTHDRPFPSAEDALKFYIEGRIYNKPSQSQEIFCSELTAETLMELGYFSTDYVANGFCPDDFDKATNLPIIQPLTYFDGARLNKWG